MAQALDYASWVADLTSEDIAAIYRGYESGHDLAVDFEAKFGQPMVDDELNASHELVIVASELDPATERIVQYLNRRGIGINVLFFRVFGHEGGQLLSRAWLVDPIDAPAPSKPDKGSKEPWNGEYYVNFGEGDSRSWAEARQFGFICGGGGAWYSRTLKQLSPGDRVWVTIPATGFVGVGIVDGPMQPLAEFTITVDDVERPAADVLTEGTYHREHGGDEEMTEYFVPVRWLQTVPREQAVRETGFLGNTNTVAVPRAASWRSTVDRLKQLFPAH
ncbi:MAG: hypothetical protein WCF36_19765 [Candidatus Nanopelagicales bacterium]